MRKMFLLFGVLALVGVLFVACSDQQDLTSPEEAAFGKGGGGATYTCSDLTVQAQKDVLEEAVDVILLNVKSRKGAHQNVDNMARKVCAEPPDYDAALLTYSKFEIEINLQNVDKLAGGETGRQALLHMAYMFASGGDYNPGFSIPPEAFGPDGGLFVIPSPGDIPPEGLELVANGYEGALRVLPGTFPDDAFPVTVVEYRLPDDYTGEYPYDFGDYAGSLTPEIWFFDASAPVDPAGPGVEVWVCLVEDLVNDPFLYDRSVIAHATDESEVELLDGDDRLTENPPAELDCAGAGAYQTASGPTTGWMRLAAALRPVTSFLGVKPLNAMYFAGKGLGGRGGALSPFGPADVLGPPEYLVSCSVSGGTGTLAVDGQPALCGQGSSVDIDDGAEATSSFLGEESYAAGTVLTLVASPGTGYQLNSLTGCDDGITDPCIVTVNGNRPLSPSFGITDTDYSLTLDGSLTGNAFGDIYVFPEGITDFQCSYGGEAAGCDPVDIPAGTKVKLTATPAEGSTFDGWALDCALATGNDCWFFMFEDKSATANFSLGYTLNLDVGPNGEVVVTPGDYLCNSSNSPCSYYYPPGTFEGAVPEVTLTAGPWDYRVVSWGDTPCYHSVGNTCLLEPAGTMTATADFPYPTLTVEIADLVDDTQFADGMVTAPGDLVLGTEGINCAKPDTGGPCTAVYRAGIPVTLSATGAGSGLIDYLSVPGGWTCPDGPTATCTIDIILNSNQGVWVVFAVF